MARWRSCWGSDKSGISDLSTDESLTRSIRSQLTGHSLIHISNMVLPTVKPGPPHWTRTMQSVSFGLEFFDLSFLLFRR